MRATFSAEATKDARMRATFSAEAVASAADPPLPIRAMTQLKLDGHGPSFSCLAVSTAVRLQRSRCLVAHFKHFKYWVLLRGNFGWGVTGDRVPWRTCLRLPRPVPARPRAQKASFLPTSTQISV